MLVISAVFVAILFPASAVTLSATAATLEVTTKLLAAGDTLAMVGSFGEVRLANRAFAQTITLDGSNATFSTTMVFDNVRNVALRGGTFNIGNNGDYAKGVAVYNGANDYIGGITVNCGITIDQFGVTVNGTHNAQVTNSTFKGLYSGIAVGAVACGFLAKNTFIASTSDGSDIFDSHGVTATCNTCRGAIPRAGAHPDCIQM